MPPTKPREPHGIERATAALRPALALALLFTALLPAVNLASAATTTISITPSAVVANTTFVQPASVVTLVGEGTMFYRLDNLTDAQYGGPFSLANVSEGNHTLSYWSNSSNVTSPAQTASFALDASPPTLSIARPTDLSWVPGDAVHFAWTASDSESGLASAAVRLDGGPWLEPLAVASHDFVGLTDGKHILSVRITDAVGLSADTAVRITVDTTGPIITLLAPTPGQVAYRGDVPLVWNVTDRDSKVTRVEIFFDGGSTAYDVTNRTSFSWRAPPAGTHAFVLRATDSNGWVTQVGQSFTVAGSEGAAAASGSSIDFVGVFAFTIIAMFAGAALPGMWRTRSGGQEPRTEGKPKAGAGAKRSTRLKDPGPRQSPDADE